MNTHTASTLRRAALASGAALVVAASTLGYSYLKPTAQQSAPIESVATSTFMAANDAGSASQSGSVYTIQSDSSSATLRVDEILRGSPFTVVGTTDQVAFDPSNPSAAQLGTIPINARSLATDDSSRNRALDNQILSTDQYEYITFTPTELTGLPTSVSAGEPFTFQATGNLTIKDVIRPATFDVTVVPTEDGRRAGSASTTIQYSDWGVSIPSVPFVASVDDDVVLQLNFAASSTS